MVQPAEFFRKIRLRRLAPTTRETYWSRISIGELCEIFTFLSFLQSTSVNNVCKVLQLLGESGPNPLPGELRPRIPLGDGSHQASMRYSPVPPNENCWSPLETSSGVHTKALRNMLRTLTLSRSLAVRTPYFLIR